MARRPLQVKELAEVLALDVDAGGIPTFNAKWRWEDHEAAVLFACSSLVSVIFDRGSRVVQFSHFSVKEFLTSDRLASMEDVSQFHIADEPSHLIIAQACLGVILNVDDRTSENRVEDIALLTYADRYWDEHVQVGKVELHIKDALDCLFDVDKPHFEALFCRRGDDSILRKFRAPSDEGPKGVLPPAAPFFVACQIGLRCLAERLIVSNRQQIIGFRLQRIIGSRLKGSIRSTLLHFAVSNERIEDARLLLTHGADINSRIELERLLNGVEGTDKIENRLQSSDSDMSAEDTSLLYLDEMGSGIAPLHLAVAMGCLDMCQVLLEHKADVGARGVMGSTPLYLASVFDHLEISRILLEYNAEVNSKNDHGSTPLLGASQFGSPHLVQLLLDRNADVHVRDADGDTPLHCAAFGGRLEVAQLLRRFNMGFYFLKNRGLTRSADHNEDEGDPDIVRLLLDHGADPQARNLSGKTASEMARGQKRREIVQWLSEHTAK